jgi:hypothetical protein
MASTYVNDLRLEEMATGDQSGTWGDTTNTNLELIAEAFSYGTQASFGSDADATTTIADGASDPARSLYLKVTSGASLTATRTLTIAPNTVSKIWIIENATSGSQSINISQGSGANVTIPNGDVKVIYTDGAGSGAAVVDAFANLKVTDAAQTNITSVGTLTGLTTTGDINFGDNDKAVFGAGSDLQIYHDGSNSFVADVGTGVLDIQTNGTEIQMTKGGAELMAKLVPDGAVTLYYDNAAKIATTSTGIDVTGTAVTDGITSSGNINLDLATPTVIFKESGAAKFFIGESSAVGGGSGFYDMYAAAGLGQRFFTAAAERMRIDSSGNVGIGTSSPAASLDVTSAASDAVFLRSSNATTSNVYITNTNATTGNTANLYFAPANNIAGSQISSIAIEDFSSSANRTADLAFSTRLNGTMSERMRIDCSGNVGIGTTSPSASLSILSSQDASTDVRHYASFGADATFDDTDVKGLYGAGIGELQIKNGTSARCGILALGGSLSAGEALGGIAFYRSGNTDGYRHRATIQGGVTSSGTTNQHGGNLVFRTAADGAASPSERMRINSLGQLLIGRTSAQHDTSGIEVEGSSSGGKGAVLFQGTGDNGPAINAYKTSTTTSSDARFIQFAANSGSTAMGAIVGNGASNVQFITLSDEREKENINPVVGALDKLMNLNVVSFDWKKHDEHVKAGFIAQNVEEHFPEYVIENIANDGEEPRKGTTGGMSAGYIAVLTKAIQEQQAQIEALQSEINLLKGE